MTNAPNRYPLAWPANRPRKKMRIRGDFTSNKKRITLDAAADRLEDEISRLGGVYALLSSNVELRMDGRPRMDRSPPADPGACAYFQLRGKPYALACDTYTEVAQNIAAVAEHIKATRMIERYGVASTAETLQAFEALPPPGPQVAKTERPWWDVLGLMRERADVESVTAMHRTKCKAAAAKGNEPALLELNLAKEAALKELRA